MQSAMTNKKIDLYLNNVVKEITTGDKLHDKEESLFGLERSIEAGEESAVVPKSKDLSLKEGDRSAVLAQNVLLAHSLDCTQPLVGDPFSQDDLF